MFLDQVSICSSTLNHWLASFNWFTGVNQTSHSAANKLCAPAKVNIAALIKLNAFIFLYIIIIF